MVTWSPPHPLSLFFVFVFFRLTTLCAVLTFWIVSLRNRTAGRRGRQNACAWRTWQGHYFRVLSWSSLTSMFSGLLQKNLFKGKWIFAKSYFKQNYCHACHTRFAVFFPLPSCCVSSLINTWTKLHAFLITCPLLCGKDWIADALLCSFVACIKEVSLSYIWQKPDDMRSSRSRVNADDVIEQIFSG